MRFSYQVFSKLVLSKVLFTSIKVLLDGFFNPNGSLVVTNLYIMATGKSMKQKTIVNKIFGTINPRIYRDKFHRAFQRLQKMPNIGHVRKDIPKEMKSYTVGQHSLIYKVKESEKEIHIYRILHVRMDFTDKVQATINLVWQIPYY